MEQTIQKQQAEQTRIGRRPRGRALPAQWTIRMLLVAWWVAPIIGAGVHLGVIGAIGVTVAGFYLAQAGRKWIDAQIEDARSEGFRSGRLMGMIDEGMALRDRLNAHSDPGAQP